MPRFHPVTGGIALGRQVWVDSRPTESVPKPRTALQDCSHAEVINGVAVCEVILSDGTKIARANTAAICAGAGDMLAWYDEITNQVHDWVGRIWPEFQGLTLDGSPDGAYALKLSGNGPWDVIEKDNSRWRLTDGDAYSIQLLGNKQAIFLNPDGSIVTTVPTKLPKYDQPWGIRAVEIDGLWRLLYQRKSDGALCFDGKIVSPPRPSYYYYDVLFGGDRRIYIIWAPDASDSVALSATFTLEELALLPDADLPPEPIPPIPPKPIPPEPKPPIPPKPTSPFYRRKVYGF